MKPVYEWDRDVLLGSLLFTPLHAVLEVMDNAEFPVLEDCNSLLKLRNPQITVSSGKPLRFIPQEHGKLPFERQYEPRCYLSGEVPTRANNWHDLFNALAWLTFPQTKAALNMRHYHALKYREMAVSGSQRGVVRDVNTLFDESGVIVASSDPGLIRLLREFRWKELFWYRRELVREAMDFLIFGHSLYEKALEPYVGMTGQGVVVEVGQEYFTMPVYERVGYLDRLLATRMSDTGLYSDTRDLNPVPLLGIPGWTEDNEYAAYYDNTSYFRSGRRKSTSAGNQALLS